jgi:3-isopropylmalate dehydrogenase
MTVTEKHLKGLAAGQMGMTTTEVGDLVAKYITEL